MKEENKGADSRQQVTPTRPLLPVDVTTDELWWLYHNHRPFHDFVERIIAEAELNWQRHHNWEKAQLDDASAWEERARSKQSTKKVNQK